MSDVKWNEPMPGQEDHWLVRRGTIRLLWIVFAVILAGTVAPDFFLEKHGYFGIDETFGFFAWFGFLSCLLMVVGAKVIGIFLKRPDTYYEDEPVVYEEGASHDG